MEWYETVAETQMLIVEEKLGKVLNVFSPGDMEVITGILDSRAGREIAKTREALFNVEKHYLTAGLIRFSSSESVSSAFAESVEDHLAKNKSSGPAPFGRKLLVPPLGTMPF